MENQITVNMENLTNEEREQLLKLIKKSNNPAKKRWKAQDNGIYYYLGTDGQIYSCKDAGDSFSKRTYIIGNYFKTKEEAEFEINKGLVYQELKDYALEHNKHEFNWVDPLQDKWTIYYDFGAKRLSVSSWHTIYGMGQIYFSSKTIAESAIFAVGEDRIKKYLFGVEE